MLDKKNNVDLGVLTRFPLYLFGEEPKRMPLLPIAIGTLTQNRMM